MAHKMTIKTKVTGSGKMRLQNAKSKTAFVPPDKYLEEIIGL
jgi:hypothetical protein